MDRRIALLTSLVHTVIQRDSPNISEANGSYAQRLHSRGILTKSQEAFPNFA